MATIRTGRYWQHGDVIVYEIAEIPHAATRVERRVLAEGEVTGHAHRLTEDADVEVYEHEGTLFLRVGPGSASLNHEEHGVGVLPAGVLGEVGRVQEYDHFAEEARAVRD